jgi:hypothetical protein
MTSDETLLQPPDTTATAIKLSERQLRDGRCALRDWLASGRDGLTASNTSLDMAVKEIVQSLFRRAVQFSS